MRKNKTAAKMPKTKTIPDGWLSSGEFAKAVGRGKTTVLRWAERKQVETKVTDRGDHLFRVEDAQRYNGNRPVETLPRAREHVPSIDDLEGKIAGRVFRRFAAGDSPEKIVCDTNIHPDIVEALLVRWARFRGGVYLDAGQVKNVRRVFTLPPIANGEQMVLRLRGLASRLDCIYCRTNAAQYCGPCQEALARSAFVVGAPFQASETHASQCEEHYTEVEAARDQALLEQALAKYDQRKRTASKQTVASTAHPSEVVTPKIENSAGTESDAVRSTEPENEAIDTRSSDSGEPKRSDTCEHDDAPSTPSPAEIAEQLMAISPTVDTASRERVSLSGSAAELMELLRAAMSTAVPADPETRTELQPSQAKPPRARG